MPTRKSFVVRSVASDPMPIGALQRPLQEAIRALSCSRKHAHHHQPQPTSIPASPLSVHDRSHRTPCQQVPFNSPCKKCKARCPRRSTANLQTKSDSSVHATRNTPPFFLSQTENRLKSLAHGLCCVLSCVLYWIFLLAPSRSLTRGQRNATSLAQLGP